MGPKTCVTSIIVDFYNQFVSRVDGQETVFHNNEGIYFCINMRHEHLGYTATGKHVPEWENSATGFYHVIITSVNQVFTAFSELGRLEDVPIECWENTSNHDSCWKTDGLQSLSSYDYALYERANSKCPPKKRPSYNEATSSIEMQSVFSAHKWVRFVSVYFSANARTNSEFKFRLAGINEFEMKLQREVDHSELEFCDDELYALKA